jgi:hypothetical protein
VTKAGILFSLKNKIGTAPIFLTFTSNAKKPMNQSTNIIKDHLNKIVIILFFVLLFIIAQSCENLEVVRVVKIETGDLYEVTKNSASIAGNIMDIGEDAVTQYGHCWATTAKPTIELDTKTELGGTIITTSFNSDLTGLLSGTTYYIRGYATYGTETAYGDELSFATNWQMSLGGTSAEWAWSVQQTTDNGLIIAGTTYSDDGDVSWHHGAFDMWIVKLTSSREIEWKKTIGGSADDYALSIQQTTDGGYIIAGNSSSNDDDVSENHGGFDCWIVKLNSSGEIMWQKSFGGTEDDFAGSIQQTTDGGYVFAAESCSHDGDVSANNGQSDFWIVKLDSSGKIIWQKSFGGSSYDWPVSIRQTNDKGYIIAGYSESYDGDVPGNWGEYDFWIMKLNSSGEQIWQNCFGGSNTEQASCIQQTTDGGYIISGLSESNDYDVSGNHGKADIWVVKLNSMFEITWQKCLGGSEDEWSTSILQTLDGGYIIAGTTYSNNGDVSGNHGEGDIWVVKLASSGDLTWQKSLGGSAYDRANCIQQISEKEYVIVGGSNSDDGDATENHGVEDLWIIKIYGN